MLKGAISIDVDTLSTHLHGFGLNQKDYDFADFRLGIENFLRFLDELKLKATFFIVGKDLLNQQNVETLLKARNAGHEIANHSMHHIQGFRFLNREQKITEIKNTQEIIEKNTLNKVVGFRAPGWNIDNQTLEILSSMNYLYDSSIFPSSFNPLLKLMHFKATSQQPRTARTTLGQIKYCFNRTAPYQLANDQSRGHYLVELPITVTPVFRLPFFATFLLKTGLIPFKASLQMIKAWQRPIIYEFHLFDFVDFAKPELKHQIPSKFAKGIYLPQSIYTPFKQKWQLFYQAVSLMKQNYQFETLETLAKRFIHHDTQI